MKKLLVFGLFVTIILAACTTNSTVQVTTPDSTTLLTAPGPNPMLNQPDGLGRVARAGAGI